MAGTFDQEARRGAEPLNATPPAWPGVGGPATATASRSSFFVALRILPREQRLAMYAIYDFCRAVDDTADGDAPGAERRAELSRWRSDVDALYDRPDEGPAAGLGRLRDAIRRFGLERADFHAVIDGMAMDVAAELRAPDWATLDLYCDRVASAAGRLSVRVFGMPAEAGRALAHHLGRGLQLTNILRDIDEDARMGRLYLPREALARAGLAGMPMERLLADPRLTAACEEVAGRARAHFAAASAIMDRAPRASVKAPRLMAAAYEPLLDQLVRRGWTPPREKVARRKLPLARAVLRYGFG